MPAEASTPARLALRPREAARALGVSERKLWGMTAPRGPIRCAKLGACIVYRVADLDAWLAAAAARSIEPGATEPADEAAPR
ncbi:MAG TPA: helix-turn-helix domain-containing protein [Phycisphaerales bacterium]|nr:helix-turn-helix domain-containing protein [Phycisphaerales bacterium]HMP36216.1 helix-turn-helix domain-containing protein [Phycisphaerales bacterium]